MEKQTTSFAAQFPQVSGGNEYGDRFLATALMLNASYMKMPHDPADPTPFLDAIQISLGNK